MLNCHPAALSAAVLARPDAKSGDVLATYIETRKTRRWRPQASPSLPCALAFARASRSSAGIIQKFALRHPAKSSSAIE
jgi:fatty-acyl-CoA synthase